MNGFNEDLREAMKAAGVLHIQVAERLGLTKSGFSKKLSHGELSNKEKERILAAVAELPWYDRTQKRPQKIRLRDLITITPKGTRLEVYVHEEGQRYRRVGSIEKEHCPGGMQNYLGMWLTGFTALAQNRLAVFIE